MKALYLAGLVAFSSAPAMSQGGGQPAVVEVIGHGTVEIRATAQRLSLAFTGKGRTTAQAEAARARKEAEVMRLLAGEGVPASAVTLLSPTDLSRLTLLRAMDGNGGGATVGEAAAGLAGDDAVAPAEEEAQGGRTVQVATLAQATSLTAKLKAIGVEVGEPAPVFDNIAAARRDARVAALGDARTMADRYATALRMRLGAIRRVSETGGNTLLPGFQEKIGTLIATGGPGLMQTMFQPPKDSINVDEAIVVEYVLLP